MVMLHYIIPTYLKMIKQATWTNTMQMILIINIVTYETTTKPIFKVGCCYFFFFKPYFPLHQNSLCFFYITDFKSWYSHINMQLKPTAIYQQSCIKNTVQTSLLFSHCEPTCLFSTTETSLNPRCTFTAILL